MNLAVGSWTFNARLNPTCQGLAWWQPAPTAKNPDRAGHCPTHIQTRPRFDTNACYGETEADLPQQRRPILMGIHDVESQSAN